MENSILNRVLAPRSHRSLSGLRIHAKHVHKKISELLEYLYDLVLANNFQSLNWISVPLKDIFYYIYQKAPSIVTKQMTGQIKIFTTCIKQGHYP